MIIKLFEEFIKQTQRISKFTEDDLAIAREIGKKIIDNIHEAVIYKQENPDNFFATFDRKAKKGKTEIENLHDAFKNVITPLRKSLKEKGYKTTNYERSDNSDKSTIIVSMILDKIDKNDPILKDLDMLDESLSKDKPYTTGFEYLYNDGYLFHIIKLYSE